VSSVRFIHAADVHLDAPFKGVDATDPRVRDALVAATYRALDAVVDACLAHEVDFLVLAGDVYNQAERSLRAEFAFRDACQRLAEAGIRVFVARGNHDPASGWSAGLTLPDTVHVFSEREVERVVFEREGEPACVLYGRSFRTAAERDNLSLGFSRDLADPLAIGVLHANVGGQPGHEPYAPCSVDDLRAARMDYWALGHIHLGGVIEESPAIVYPGCTQGLDPNESGLRGCRLVTLDARGATVDFVPTSAVVWAKETVAADSAATLDDLAHMLGAAADRAFADAAGRPAIVRISLEGRTSVHAALSRPGVLGDLLEDARADALGREPWVWIDRIVDHTRPVLDLAAVAQGEDFAGDLVRIGEALLADDRALLAYIEDVARPVLGALDARDVPEVDAAAVLERARDLALDRLLAGEGR
jgi:DNA repair exonuclease SbcCD nuclease subunit